MPKGAEGPVLFNRRAGLFWWLGFCFMRSDIGIECGDAQPLGRILGQALQASCCPKAATFGFEGFEIKIGHCLALGQLAARVNHAVPITADMGNGP